MPERKCVAFKGSWDADSGGCDLNPYWFKRNPKYLVVPHEPLHLTICLSRVPSEWKVSTPLENMIGFYVCTASDESGTVAHPAKSKCAESLFLPLATSSITYELKRSVSSPAFLIVPCTYGPGRKGNFQLSLSSNSPAFEVVET
jgi:Calpain large subunit, domain III